MKVDRLGTVPAWLSAILTGLSVLFALWIIFRDKKRHESEQARQVSAWEIAKVSVPAGVTPSDEDVQHTVHVYNASSSPALNVALYLRSATRWELWRASGKAKTAGLQPIPRKAKKHSVEYYFLQQGEAQHYLYPEKELTMFFLYTLEINPSGPQPRKTLEPLANYAVYLSFNDTSGTRWFRNVRTGTMKPGDRWWRKRRLKMHWPEPEHARRLAFGQRLPQPAPPAAQ